MNNHFYIAYFGNKRREMKYIYNNEIKNLIDNNIIDTIIEPYCGSSSMSYYIWMNNKDKNLKFILNDNNKYLYEMYKIYLDDNLINEFNIKINSFIKSIYKDKQKYNDYLKDNDDIYSWFIKNKLYSIRPGLYPLRDIFKFDKIININDYKIKDFFKNANILYTCMDGIECYNLYKNDYNNLLLIDPPYINSNNSNYLHKMETYNNIYEYLYNNKIKNEKAHIFLILENNFIIMLLFKKYLLYKYEKKYEVGNKRITNHIIFYNKTYNEKKPK